MQGDRYSMDQQVLNFESTLDQYRAMMNETALYQYLAKSIAIVVSGNNDYINNYLLPPFYGSSFNYTAPEFGNLLVNSYVRQILVISLSLIYLLLWLSNSGKNLLHFFFSLFFSHYYVVGENIFLKILSIICVYVSSSYHLFTQKHSNEGNRE